MRFLIENPVPLNIPYECFVVHIRTYQGDGDGYFETVMAPFKRGEHEDNLECLVGTLERMLERSKHGMSWRDDYEQVLGFQQWFGSCKNLEDLKLGYSALTSEYPDELHQNMFELAEGFRQGWRNDAITNYETPLAIDSYRIYYYSETGEQFNVSVER